MSLIHLKKYKSMILISILFFYLGCGITISFLNIDCTAALSTNQAFSSPGNNEYLNEVEYAVLVISGPDNENKRDAIRATWANFVSNIFIENGERLYRWNHSWVGQQTLQSSNQFIKFFFVLGIEGLDENKLEKIKIENSRRKDLLSLDFKDTYQKLTTKLLQSFQWLSKHLKNLKYVIKSDDDSFVRIDLIIRDLEAFAPEMNAQEIGQFVTYKKDLPIYRGLYWGYFNGRAKVFLNGKWEERDWFLCDTYLPYAQGGGYVVSRSIVDYIARNAEYLSHYNSEDVSMGVWTASLDGINRVHDIRFDTEWKSRGCDPYMLVRHKQTPSDMFQMYRTLVHSHGQKLCKSDATLRKVYRYNWNVLPSMCCH